MHTHRDGFVPLERSDRASFARTVARRTSGVVGLVARGEGEGAVVGGVAASLHGEPRVTRDIDIVALVADDAWADFVSIGAKFGIQPRRADVLE